METKISSLAILLGTAFGVNGVGKGCKDISYPPPGLTFEASLLHSSLPVILLMASASSVGSLYLPAPHHETPTPSLAQTLLTSHRRLAVPARHT